MTLEKATLASPVPLAHDAATTSRVAEATKELAVHAERAHQQALPSDADTLQMFQLMGQCKQMFAAHYIALWAAHSS